MSEEDLIEEYEVNINIKCNVFTNSKIKSKLIRINQLLGAESMSNFLDSFFDEIDDCNFSGGYTNFNVSIEKIKETEDDI